MKIGIVSDTHGDKQQMKKVLIQLKDTDCILHAGDVYRDIIWMQQHFGKPVNGVTGNSDPADAGPAIKILKSDGLTIMLCHGHIHRVQQNLMHLYYKGLEKQADVIIYGHTHIPALFSEGVLMINPGSLSRPRSAYGPTYAVLETKPQLSVSIHSLETGRSLMNLPRSSG